jgi:hypothetical protein
MVESNDRTPNPKQGENMKLTLVNHQKLIEAGKATRLGAHWPGQRCFAKTRQGTPCRNPVVTDRNRCRMHGGKSTGPRTPEGKARSIAAHTKHGRRSKAHIERIRQINADLRRVLNAMRMEGLIP